MNKQQKLENTLMELRSDLQAVSGLLDLVASGDYSSTDGFELDPMELVQMLARTLRTDYERLCEVYHIVEMLPSGTIDACMEGSTGDDGADAAL